MHLASGMNDSVALDKRRCRRFCATWAVQDSINGCVVGWFGDIGDQYFDVFLLHRVADFLEAAGLRQKLSQEIVAATNEDVLRLIYTMSAVDGFCVPYFSFTTRGIVRGDPGSDTIPRDWMPTHPWTGFLYDPESADGMTAEFAMRAADALRIQIEPCNEQAMLCARLSEAVDMFRKQWFEVADVLTRGAPNDELVRRRVASLWRSLEGLRKVRKHWT